MTMVPIHSKVPVLAMIVATSAFTGGIGATAAESPRLGGANAFPAGISIPENIDPSLLRLGMPGTATVFADNAGVISLIAWILIWIHSYVAYL